VKLPSGDWNVTALISDDRFTRHSEDDGSFASKTTLVTASPKSGGSDAADVQKIDLFGVPGIEGSISFPIDTTFPVLSVVATRLAPGEGADPSLLDWNRPGGNRTRESELAQESEDRSRNFRFGRIEKGRWLVGVFDRRLEAPLATAEVEVGAGVTRIEFKLGSHEARPELRVRVADPDGALLRDCTFHSRRTISLPNGMRSKSDGDPAARRTIDGAFAIESVRLGPDCTLLAHHPRFGTKAIAVPTDAKELAVRFDAPAAPKLRVAGITEHAAGRKVDLEVARADEEDPSFGWPQIRFDASAIAADEIVALGNLQPGSWRVRVLCNTDSSNQFGFRGFQVAEATFELAAGPQEITLPFPELSTLRLAVAAGVKETFSLESATASKAERIRAWQNATPDASGVITFKDLPPGLYEVSASGGRHLAVEVPSPNVVDFVAEAVNALRVVVADPKGALAKAGLRSGDLVVAIDGREFAGRQELEWIRQSLRGDDVTLTVTRRGDPFEVVIKRSFLTEERAAGGRFREASR
jgi:hypothetical protein